MRLPPTVAMLRICAEAPARMAWASRGKRSRTRRSAATAVFFTPADAQASVARLVDIAGEAGDVDKHIGMLDGLAHQVDKIGAAAEISRAVARAGRERCVHI